MYIKKGKPIFGYRDTFSLEYTLRPIIGSALVEFHKVVKNNKSMAGVPSSVYCELHDKGAVVYQDENYTLSDEDYEIAQEYWFDVIEEIVYCFTSCEPEMEDYNFSINFTKVDGKSYSKIVCTNENERLRYYADVKEYHERVQNGYNLFAKHFKDLWW